MSRRKKIAGVFLVGLSVYLFTLLIAFFLQKNIHQRYGQDFNKSRRELGIYPINDFQEVEFDGWPEFYPDNPVRRWFKILTNTEIPSTTTYENFENGNEPFHKLKTVYFGTNLCFWQNYYAGEIDLFIKPIDSVTQIELTLAYFSENIEPRNYFYADIDTIRHERHEFICGMAYVDDYGHEEETPKGNLTKQQADLVLTEWKLK